ncbi:carboxynorspermidine decarboxylase [Spirochaeta thermophila]|uniref:Carboxynorspermidine/carboxyspermidine decarboxylase n=1 Tax=Winmispira thermophila (strain ATCC 49972 / DSM 6192 / RI 19.B1) TaxID=665571 RepID=E0RP78_WINT6|nr:carboxynorspermidine decarboxylase [Spirochaeta thermophila]ADN01272.1 carboxynorspermidine decarboxylase [Spirochaeta thermophila DSM 6192]
MREGAFQGFDPQAVPSPCFVVDRDAVEENLKILDRVQREGGARVLLALKGFAMWSLAPLVSSYLSGTCASGVWEARLGRECFGGIVSTYGPAYKEDEVRELLTLTDHLIFNSFSQWERFGPLVGSAPRRVEAGIRVNPERSGAPAAIYDPSGPNSRLGVVRSRFRPELLDGISGLHFHTLCEQNVDALEAVLQAFEERFGEFVPRMRWVNWGGGHHITRPDYDVDRLIDLVRDFRSRYGVDVYLEPGEAIALGTGVLVAEVVDIVENGMRIAVLDTSATTHMPDVLEMPYRPEVWGAGLPGERPYTYRLGGISCLAGDVIGDYSFDRPLEVGDRLVFDDMAHYTMVKTTTFNGVKLPSIGIWSSKEQSFTLVRSFEYEEFKRRLS